MSLLETGVNSRKKDECPLFFSQDDLRPVDYNKPPGAGNGFGADDLVVRSCDYPARKPVTGIDPPLAPPRPFGPCKEYPYTLGAIPFPTGGGIVCANNLTTLCLLIKVCKGKKKFQRVTFVGHCGGDEGVITPGITFTKPPKKPGNRFGPPWDLPTIKCIQDALAPGGILTICSCGYQATSPGWDQQLQDLANLLGHPVCACKGPGNPDSHFGCFCQKECKYPWWWFGIGTFFVGGR